MNRKIKSSQFMIFGALKLLWKLGLFVLEFAVAFASDKPSRKPYSALNAQHLHDEGLISDKQYAKSVFPGKN